MRKVVAIVLVGGFAASSALAGTVMFDPPKQEVGPGGGSSTFNVWVEQSDLGSFNSVDMIIGSVDLDVVAWEFDPGFIDKTLFTSASIPASPPVYPSDAQVGGFAVDPIVPPNLIGWVTVESFGLPLGSYDVMVDSDFDGGRSKLALGVDTEPLFGSGTVNVVPEPAALSLLGLGALALLRRRKA